MDTRDQQNLPLHTFFTLFSKKTYKSTFPWRKNFSKITLLLILPALSLLFAEIQASNTINSRIIHQTVVFKSMQAANEHQPSDLFSTEEYWFFLGIIKFLCLFPLFVLSPILISAAVHYEASSNLNREAVISKKVSVKIAFRLLKRLLINSYQDYLGVLFFITLLMVVFTCFGQALAALSFVSFLDFLYLMGLVYLCLTWHMIIVISVLDEVYINNNNLGSIKPLESYEIIDGKMWAKAILLFKLVFVHVITNLAPPSLFWHETSVFAARLLYGFSCCLSLALMSLLALIVQTAAFLICKSHRLERFEKWCNLLGDDMVEPCQSGKCLAKVKDIQKEQLQV